MEKVRGFVYFENRNIDEIREDFKDFKISGLKYVFFNGLTRLKKRINLPGILVDGDVEINCKADCSAEIVRLLRERVGLLGDNKNCDVSSAANNEDYIVHIKKGDSLEGSYLAIRMLPPYPSIRELERIASSLRNVLRADDILLRGVEKMLYKDNEIDKKCIDMIGEFDFHAGKKELENYLESNNVVLEGYTLIDLL